MHLKSSDQFEAILFKLAENSPDLYAIDLQDLREVLLAVPLHRVPTEVPYLSGMCSLRGRIVPVLDLHYMAYSSHDPKPGNYILTEDEEGPVAFAVHSINGICRASVEDLVGASAVFKSEPRMIGAILKRKDQNPVSVLDMKAVLRTARSGAVLPNELHENHPVSAPSEAEQNA